MPRRQSAGMKGPRRWRRTVVRPCGSTASHPRGKPPAPRLVRTARAGSSFQESCLRNRQWSRTRVNSQFAKGFVQFARCGEALAEPGGLPPVTATGPRSRPQRPGASCNGQAILKTTIAGSVKAHLPIALSGRFWPNCDCMDPARNSASIRPRLFHSPDLVIENGFEQWFRRPIAAPAGEEFS